VFHRLSPRHGEEEEPTPAQCRDTYNYKHPHPCSPGVNCDFVVRWQPLEGQGKVEFEVVAALSGLDHTSVWVALGFSSNPDMVSYPIVTRDGCETTTAGV
jgi:hypothetical protein